MIAFIDCYIDTPVFNCVNQFTENTCIPSTYHVASKFGTASLKVIKDPKCYVILGSAAHVTQNLPWQQELLDFIIPKLESGIPVLGICYGHQLMASYYGCDVGFIDQDETHYKELREVQLLKNLGNQEIQKLHFAYAHSQIVKSITNDFDVLGSSHRFPYEILKHKKLPLVSTQAHPEASRDYLKDELKVGEYLEKTLKDGQSFILNFYNLFS